MISINGVTQSSMNEAIDIDTKKDLLFRLKKLRTEASEALYQYEELDKLTETRDILGYLARDSKDLLTDIKKILAKK